MNATSIVIAGVIATATADVWQQMLKHGANLPISNWRLIGRWVGAMGRGAFAHAGIADTPPIEGERAIGWTFHYAVGIAYAALYSELARALPDASPSVTSALLFGVATLAAPWFVLQPALGLGVMAWRLPKRRAVFWVTGRRIWPLAPASMQALPPRLDKRLLGQGSPLT